MNDSFTLGDLGTQRPTVLEGLALPPSLRAAAEQSISHERSAMLADAESEMPLLSALSSTDNNRPFQNFRVIIVLHFLHDLLFFIAACERLGMEPARTLLLFKAYPYRSKKLVANCLVQWGYTIAPVEDRATVVPHFLSLGDEKVLVIEDGGYIVPLLHETLTADLPRVIGAVEQTTKGRRRDEETESQVGALKFPVLSVADSDIKADFEPNGVAHAVLANIRQLASREVWEGKRVLVVGYGAIGRALVHHLRNNRIPVFVCDNSIYKRALARWEGCETADRLADAFRFPGLRLVIGATGNEAIGQSEIQALPNAVYLASASSDRVEIGVAFLEENCERIQVSEGCSRFKIAAGREVQLLAEGYPVNFFGADSVQNQVIDLVMTQILLAARYVVSAGQSHAPGIDRLTVNRLSEKADLVGQFYRRHYQTTS